MLQSLHQLPWKKRLLHVPGFRCLLAGGPSHPCRRRSGTSNLLQGVALARQLRNLDANVTPQRDGPMQPRTRRGEIVDQLRSRVRLLTFMTNAGALAMQRIADAQ